MAATPQKNIVGVSRTVFILGIISSLCIGFYAGNFSAAVGPAAHGQEQQAQLTPELAVELRKNITRTQQEPNNAEAWTALGNMYYDLHKHEESIAAYEKALRLAPGKPDVLVDMGVMYRAVKQPEKAIECFDKALQVSPAHQLALLNKGIVLRFDLGKTTQAKDVWMSLLRINPKATMADGTPLSTLLKDM